MTLDLDLCYGALQARDHRFDGRFFVAVTSTRVYCRPICTVRLPKRENCRFYPSAAAAEDAGFRPCLRCRPELAPGNASVDATRRLAFAAANLIEAHQLEQLDVETLATQLRVSDRHLRRVFMSEFGVSPVAFAATQRLLLAKRLLTDTMLPVTEVAFASGFGSVRRFNQVFRERYRLKPSELRKCARDNATEGLSFELGLRPPYDWNAMLAFLQARSIAGVEAVGDEAYRRAVRIEHQGHVHTGWLQVTRAAQKPALRVELSLSLAKVIPLVITRVKALMDLSCEPTVVAAALGPLASARPGLRVPGAFDGFEMAVRAVLGQQISVAAARTIAGRIAATFGEPLVTPFAELRHTFPSAAALAAVTPEQLGMLGIVRARVRSIQSLAAALAGGELVLDARADVAATLERLCELPGIGAWTAQYIAMRALSWPDAFPHTDLGVMKALGKRRPQDVLAAAEGWRPWRAYAVMHLWHSLSAAPAAAAAGATVKAKKPRAARVGV